MYFGADAYGAGVAVGGCHLHLCSARYDAALFGPNRLSPAASHLAGFPAVYSNVGVGRHLAGTAGVEYCIWCLCTGADIDFAL